MYDWRTYISEQRTYVSNKAEQERLSNLIAEKEMERTSQVQGLQGEIADVRDENLWMRGVSWDMDKVHEHIAWWWRRWWDALLECTVIVIIAALLYLVEAAALLGRFPGCMLFGWCCRSIRTRLRVFITPGIYLPKGYQNYKYLNYHTWALSEFKGTKV